MNICYLINLPRQVNYKCKWPTSWRSLRMIKGFSSLIHTIYMLKEDRLIDWSCFLNEKKNIFSLSLIPVLGLQVGRRCMKRRTEATFRWRGSCCAAALRLTSPVWTVSRRFTTPLSMATSPSCRSCCVLVPTRTSRLSRWKLPRIWLDPPRYFLDFPCNGLTAKLLRWVLSWK